ncbi:phosphoribosyltransferase [Candidatus Pacearchaeota archaeon]|nr:phosphoribosyltransferase [Candidatus Pacearchaeota archaeon]
MSFPNLIKAIKEAQQINCNNYKFNKYSFGEEGTFLTYEIIKEIKEGLLSICNKFNPDYIVSTEPGGHLWGLLIASEIGKPINIIRSTNNKLTLNKNIRRQRTGYCIRKLYFDNFREGDSVIIVEDVIGTGSTLKLIIDTLKSKGVKIQAALSILRKGIDKLDIKYKIPILSIIDLRNK